MSNKRVITENFESISKLLSTISSRKNNEPMRGNDSAEHGEYSFTKTHNFKEATELCKYGYTEILEELKREEMNNKVKYNELFTIEKKIPSNAVVGYAPNVPNAIRGIPQSMINKETISQKIKTIDIVYIFGASACVSQKDLIKAGISLVSALNIIEAKGIRTRLRVCFMPSSVDEEIAMPLLNIKNFNENFNLQKISFPLVHPSMFRRIGFKWLETNPDIKSRQFNGGYGRPIRYDEDLNVCKKQLNIDDKQNFMITFYQIEEIEYDVKKILEKFKII